MKRDAIFDAWAPASSPWSPWVKPILFAEMREDEPTQGLQAELAPAWIPAADGATALLLDVSGARGLSLALDLTTRGWRPIPVYGGLSARQFDVTPAVDVEPLIAGLASGAQSMPALDAAAPPLFVLDARRRIGDAPRTEDVELDNRWEHVPSDFPSAAFLRSRAIESACVVGETSGIAGDLGAVLLGWQDGGVRIRQAMLGTDEAPCDRRMVRPSWLAVAWDRLTRRLRTGRPELRILGASGG